VVRRDGNQCEGVEMNKSVGLEKRGPKGSLVKGVRTLETFGLGL